MRWNGAISPVPGGLPKGSGGRWKTEMGRYVFTLPDVGEGIAEVEVVQWHVAAGADIKEDAPLVDVLTEKATVEIPSPRTGRVVSITGKPGEKIRVGSEIMVLETD